MTGPLISIHIDPATKPMAVHVPALIHIHWNEEVKQQLHADVALAVIKKVDPKTPTTWYHCAIWIRKPDGNPRRVVNFQKFSLTDTASAIHITQSHHFNRHMKYHQTRIDQLLMDGMVIIWY